MSPASRLACLLMLSLSAGSILTAQSASTTKSSSTLSSLPLQFEPNRGQVAAPVLYQARGADHGVFFTKDGVTIAARAKTHGSALKMRFVNENAAASLAPLDPLPGKSNYLRSKDPSSWVTNIPTYARLSKHSIYPGVDAVFYGAGNRLEYDLHVAPGADPKQIVVAFEGADHLALNAHGDLVIRSGDFLFTQHRPVTYQFQNGKNHVITSSYKMLAGNRVAFEVGPYDKTKELIIDPQLVYSSYFGGQHSEQLDQDGNCCVIVPAYNTGLGVATDSSGNVYLHGFTNAYDFPTTIGAYQSSVGMSCTGPPGCDPADSFVIKLSPSGTVLFSTYMGRSHDAFTVDATGRSYLVGSFGNSDEGYDTFLTILNSAGSAVVAHYDYTFWSGVAGVRLGADGKVFIAGYTNDPNLPVTPGAYQSALNCGDACFYDAYVMKVDPGSGAVLYATWIGGTQDEFATGLSVDEIGNAFITGTTVSSDYPHTKSFGSGAQRSFVTKLNASGTALLYSDLILGGESQAIALDKTNHAHIVGAASGSGFPTTTNAFDRTYAGGTCPGDLPPTRPCHDAFLTRLSIDGSAIQYSTLFGGGYDDEGVAVLVDGAGNALVGGTTRSGSFPLTADADDKTYAGGTCFGNRCQDGFLSIFNSAGALKYSTYFGGSGNDGIKWVALDPSGNIYVTGATSSSDLKTTANAAYRTKPGNFAAFLAKFSVASSSTTCNPPSTAGVNICSPAAGSTVSSPVRIVAAAKTTNTTVRMELWIDGAKKTTVTGNKLDYSATLGAGGHVISVYGIDSGGSKVNKKISITVK